MIHATFGLRCAMWRATLTRIFAPVLFASLCLLSPNSTLGADRPYPGLSDGLEILSAFRSVHPGADRIHQEWTKRVPEETRKQAESSDWARRQAAMTPEQLDDAASDPDVRIVPTPDGLAAIPNEKLARAIRGMAEFAIDQDDIVQLIEPIRDRFPPALQSAIGAIIDHLPQARKDRLVRLGVITAIEQFVAKEVDAHIDPLSESIRQGVFNQGASAILAKARQDADVLRKKVAQAAAERRAAEAEQQKQREAKAKEEAEKQRSGQTPPAADPKSDQERLAELKASIGRDLVTLEDISRKFDLTLRGCQTARNALPRLALVAPNVDEALARRKLIYSLIKETITRADRFAGSASSATRLIATTRDAADKVCTASSGTSGPEPTRRLEAMLGIVQGTYDGISGQIRATLIEIADPVDQPNESVRQPVRSAAQICATVVPRLDASMKEPVRPVLEALFRLQSKLADAESLAGPNDPEIELHKIRWANLQSAIRRVGPSLTECFESIKDFRELCGNLDGVIKRMDTAFAEAASLEKDRVRTIGRLKTTLAELERDYKAARAAIETARACVSANTDDKSDAAQESESLLGACRFKESSALIKALPDGPRRAALLERWNNAYQAERRARDLYKQAMAMRKQGEPGKAIGILHQARDYATCDATSTAIDKAIVAIQRTIDAQRKPATTSDPPKAQPAQPRTCPPGYNPYGCN